MCGRFTLQISPEILAKVFNLQELSDIEPRYNIAPSQQIASIRHVGDHNKLYFMKWAYSQAGLKTPHIPL
jgi:putative SOS response-associated peptidase YedK